MDSYIAVELSQLLSNLVFVSSFVEAEDGDWLRRNRGPEVLMISPLIYIERRMCSQGGCSEDLCDEIVPARVY